MEQVLFPEHLCKIINECNEQPQSYERLKYSRVANEIEVFAVFICDKTHVDFHQTFASIFSAFTTSILKILS